MKTTKILAAASFALTGVIALVTGRADGADGVAVWEGSGTAYSSQGAVVSTFSISLTRKQAGRDVRIDGKATLANGQEVPFWEEEEHAKDTGKFQIRSSTGSGAGGCFANEICQSYRQSEDGHATATTIAVDSADKVRLQWTEYDHQQVVQYREATLTKKP
jgi:hypothetical protein